MGRNRSIKSLAQVARLCLVSASLLILVLFNVSQADVEVSSSANSTGGPEQCLEESFATSSNPAKAANDEAANSRQAKIGGKNLASFGQFPFHVGVYERSEYICGGALIDDQRILTTRECSGHNPGQLTVALGDLDRLDDDGEITRTVRDIIQHPDTNLAILFIDPISLERGPKARLTSIQPIPLPDGPQSIQGNIIITGWGSEFFNGPLSRDLKYGSVSVVQCRLASKGKFCTRQSPVGPCRGDQGGPAFKRIEGGFSLVGIMDKGDCQEECNNPACNFEYVDISQYVKWIKESW